MSIADLGALAGRWLDAHAFILLGACLMFVVLGTLIAWIGRRGRTDADGRLVANVVIGVSVALVVLEIGALLALKLAFETSILEVNVALLITPPLMLLGALAGIHLIFPLNELASIRSLIDVSVFVAAVGIVLVVLSYFRGWGVIFHGGLIELAVIGLATYVLLKRLYRRAFGRR